MNDQVKKILLDITVSPQYRVNIIRTHYDWVKELARHEPDTLEKMFSLVCQEEKRDAVTLLLPLINPQNQKRSVNFYHIAVMRHKEAFDTLLPYFKKGDLQENFLSELVHPDHFYFLERTFSLFTEETLDLVFVISAQQGYKETVQFLSQHVDLKKNCVGALIAATQSEKTDIIKYLLSLLPFDLPQEKSLDLLIIASYTRNKNIFHLVCPLGDPKAALVEMKNRNFHPESCELLIERVKIEDDKRELLATTEKVLMGKHTLVKKPNL